MQSKIKSNTLIGIVIIFIGSLLLLSNLKIFPDEYLTVLFKWQAILVLIGAVIYVNANNKSLGIALAIIGILGWIPEIWSILLILLGGYIILKNQNKNSSIAAKNISTDKYNNIHDVSIFGGSKKSFQIENFKGGNITAIFGGSEIDLMDSTLAEGINRLDVFYLFGGSNLKVPSDWNVYIQTINILGGIKDKRVIQQNHVIDKNKQLIITGIILFGGGVLKNYVTF